MYTISSYSVIDSIDKALVPGSKMIDDRSERDMLWFITEFAGLINFYNSDNYIEGSWKPFMLKDPVFLLAYISKTPFRNFYSTYSDTCISIEAFIKKHLSTEEDIMEAYKLLNQLFRRLYDVYEQIGCWSYYMQLSAEEYALSGYAIELIKNTFSPLYSALRAMHSYVFVLLDEKLKATSGVLAQPEYFNNDLWQQHKGNGPWWEILGLQYKPHAFLPVEKHTIDIVNYSTCYSVLKKAAVNIFHFFKNMISYAVGDFEKLAVQKSRYPDTTLLRAFVRLLTIHQAQLNSIANKHLDFYYRDILQQKLQVSQPGSVYISAMPKNAGSAIKLPAGTAFTVTTDNNKNQVYCTVNDETLHPVTLETATTLSYISLPAVTGLYAAEISNPGTTRFTQDGRVESWKTFSGDFSATSPEAAMGVAFASPMLYLPEGLRTITITFSFAAQQGFDVLSNAMFFFSTQKSWFQLPLDGTVKIEYLDTVGNTITTSPYAGARLVITLEPDSPPIENFTVNPDSVNSQWPLFRILFSKLTEGLSPTIIQDLTITTTVSGVKNFKLFNENGAIVTKNPYPALGTDVLENSSFIIGSNEIFSKPFTELVFAMEWSNLPKLPATSPQLPDDFETYYSVYNKYCQQYPVTENAKAPAAVINQPVVQQRGLKKLLQLVANKLSQAASWLIKEVKSFFCPAKVQPDAIFNNGSFITGFQLLQNASWQTFSLKPPVNYSLSPQPVTGANVVMNPVKTFLPYAIPNSLFRVTGNNRLVDTSVFELVSLPGIIPTIIPDPAIQNTVLNFTDKSSSGFMRMQLSGPKQGFGSGIYSKVVAYIATQNALGIIKSSDWFSFSKPAILQPANPPFVPKVSSLTATYTASQTYNLVSLDGQYPVQCFLYSPFAVYEVYNNTPGSFVGNGEVITAIASPVQQTVNGVPLFPVFNSSGALLLGFSRLAAGSNLSLYFELARTNSMSNKDGKISCSCLLQNGWQSLQPLFDGTNNFNGSGLIKFHIPAGITNSSAAMKGKNYWIALSATGKLKAFPETVSLGINGFQIQQADASFSNDIQSEQKITVSPVSVKSVKPLAAVVQQLSPVPTSVNRVVTNRMISARLKTKDRLVTRSDFYTLLCRHFTYIFHTAIVTPRHVGSAEWPDAAMVKIYIVKKAGGYSEPNALVPFVTQGEEIEIEQFLVQKISPLIRLQVCNFIPVYVSICINVMLQKDFEKQEGAISVLISKALNLYLSPWISCTQKQAVIEAPLTDAGVADCILDIEGVAAVSKVNFQTWTTGIVMPDYVLEGVTVVNIKTPGYLFISSLNHTVTFNQAA